MQKNILTTKISFQFFLYCLCGGIGVAVDLSTFYCLLLLDINYQIANLWGYASGTVASFFLNRKITFEIKNRLKTRLVIFLGVASIGFLTSAAILEVLVYILNLDPKYSKIITLPFIVLLQFYLNKKITFKK